MSLNAEPDLVSTEKEYKVVALKYRPKSFGDLVGQSQIATALSNAINKNRVGHAYLFTGARGVGKTSSARIFAKCLNCEQGPTMTPCNSCDTCEAISAGEDVDVLEIDGASNRGIDEIRQLRSNAAVRPSRSRYKIYIIDEVHMLTTPAFNALLKTLEEPPGHVKFIFCTTDPQKIPITVLSRCQRFDFSPVQTDEIAGRLREIVQSEGATADEAALALLARRANGSMRDSQSLLEQLFSFCGTDISVAEVHQLLGTTDMSRIAEIATAMANHDPRETLTLIHQAVTEGVDAGQIANQLLGYFRDLMAVHVGCGLDTILNCTAADVEHLKTLNEHFGLETILTIVQLLDAAVVRMQSSLHTRTLLEAVAVRICNLESLESIADLVKSLSQGGAKTAVTSPARTRPRVELQQVNTSQAATKPPAKAGKAKSETVKSGKAKSANKTAAASQPAATKPAATKPPQAQKKNEIAEAAESVANPPKMAHAAENSTQPTEASQQAQPTESFKPRAAANGELGGVATSAAATSAPSPTPPQPLETAAASPDAATATASSLAGNIEAHWKMLLEAMGDMTADMASDYEKLVLKSPDHLEVTLVDVISRDLCCKPERKEKFEAGLEAIIGQPIRVDFLASAKAVQAEPPAPKLSRVQQIRKLQEEPFLKAAIAFFDAEIVNFRDPLPPKKI